MAEADKSAGNLYLATVVLNVQDMQRAMRFWTTADFIVLRDPEGNEFCVIDHPDP